MNTNLNKRLTKRFRINPGGKKSKRNVRKECCACVRKEILTNYCKCDPNTQNEIFEPPDK